MRIINNQTDLERESLLTIAAQLIVCKMSLSDEAKATQIKRNLTSLNQIMISNYK